MKLNIQSLLFKSGAVILAIGGTVAAGIQTLGHVRTAGGIMLAANLIVISLAILNKLNERKHKC